MSDHLYVLNSRKEKEDFRFRKVYESARRVGASPIIAERIAKEVQEQAIPGIKTSQIYSKVRRALARESDHLALKYSLKKGMRRLGPTGFPFEIFIKMVFQKLGFNVKLNQMLPGFCLKEYEIDFLAERKDLVYVGECKYRNLPGDMVHANDALIAAARYQDLLNGPFFKKKKYQGKKIKAILVTNTKFTSRTLDYAKCAGMDLLGWRCPNNKGLEYIIEQGKIYPVTILPSSEQVRKLLLNEKVILAEEVLKIDPLEFAKKNNISSNAIVSVKKEAETLFLPKT